MTNRTTPETAFTLPTVLTANEAQELTDTIITRTEANLSVLAEFGADLTEGFTIQHKDVMNVLWGLEGSLYQLRKLSEIAQ